ncbi:MAG TPA: hypothetical protein VKT81_05385, partial [Bryobacteraceae bacterium]|nr:hypothetical protein [Bryobacteraceae bacterium]
PNRPDTPKQAEAALGDPVKAKEKIRLGSFNGGPPQTQFNGMNKRIGARKPPLRRREVASVEEVQPSLRISFLAGELVRYDSGRSIAPLTFTILLRLAGPRRYQTLRCGYQIRQALNEDFLASCGVETDS